MTNLAAYRRFWHPLALMEEILDKPHSFELLGEKLVAFRTKHGISVFKDVCIHRGCALSVGRLTDDRIECAYHGWQYDHTGKCVRIPALDAAQSIPSKAKAVVYRTQDLAGLLWVALEEPQAPMPAFPEDCEFSHPELRSFHLNTYDWSIDAGRAMENFLDVAHFGFVHDGSLGDQSQTLVAPYDVKSDDFAIRYDYPQLQPGDPTTGGDVEIVLRFLYQTPFTVHIKREASQSKWSCVSLFIAPVSETRCRVFVTIIRNFDLDPALDKVYASFVDSALKEDENILSNVHPEQIPIDLREELHIRIPDAAGLEFRRMLGRIEKAALPIG